MSPEPKTPKQQTYSFDVVVEQVIGTVDIGTEDTHPFETPFETAMQIISHHQIYGPDSQNATYRFPGFGDMQTVEVTVAHLPSALDKYRGEPS